MDFDFARAQGGRDFEPDEAGAQHDGPTRSLRSFDDGVAIGERAQQQDVRLFRARDRGPHRLRACGQKKLIERDRLSVGEPDLMRARVNLHNGRVETKVDVRYDHRRFIMDTSRPAYVPGIRATYFVPFTGDGGLFKLQ